MTEQEKEIVTRMARAIMRGEKPSADDSSILIKGLCETYSKEREGRVPPCSGHSLQRD